MIGNTRLRRAFACLAIASTMGVAFESPGHAATSKTTKKTAKTTKKPAAKKTTAKTTSSPTASAVASPTTGASSAPATTTAAAPGSPRRGGTLVYLHGSETSSMSPAVSTYQTAVNGQRLFMVYDALFWKPDDKGNYSPRIGQSITSPDGITWTLKLRSGVKFSDGTPFDAAAVKANFEFHATPANRSVVRVQADQIDRMEIPDPLTLVMTLKGRNTQFDTLLARQMTFIFSPTAMASKGPDKFSTEPVGAGPFLLKEWVRDNRQVFVRNPNYWDAPKPYLDQVTVSVVSDTAARVNTFLNGTGDLFPASDISQLGSILDKGYKYEVQGLYGGTAMLLNNARPPFDDVRMRKAIQLAVNRTEYNQILFNGKAPMIDTIAAKGTLFYDSTITQPCCDLDAAQKLINAYTQEKTGGRSVSFTMTWPTATRPEGEYLQQLFNTRLRNVDAKLDLVDTPTLQNALTITRNFQMGFLATNFTEPELEFYASFRGGSSTNYFNFNDPQMNSVLDKMRESKDLTTRKAMFTAAQQVLFDQVPVVYLRRNTAYNAYTDKVRGYDSWSDNLIDWAALWKAA